MSMPNIECLKNFTDHRFEQLMRYEDGRTPLYLTEEQYNAIRDLVAKASAAPALSADDQVSALRRKGLSIDGDNAYKRDLIDTIVGALAFGKQGVNPPPAGHWGKQFWDIGRAEGEEQERLINQRDAILLRRGAAPEQERERKLHLLASVAPTDANLSAMRREGTPCEIPSTISMAIEAAEQEHGSLRAAAKVIGVDAGYLSRLKSGDATNPGDGVLAALGLEKVVTYRTLLSASAEPAKGGEVKA